MCTHTFMDRKWLHNGKQYRRVDGSSQYINSYGGGAEYEKYKIEQDKLYISDFDKLVQKVDKKS